MLRPRKVLEETRAQGQLRGSFFKQYMSARMLNGSDRTATSVAEVFELPLIERLRSHLSNEALRTPVILTDHLSNRVLSVLLLWRTDRDELP